jgi:hypothetical protein
MKKIAKKAEEKEYEYILCPCSSDPDSLDAVILPAKKVVILDGTAPHEVNPRYPAVCEEILNFGQFWNADKITDKKAILTLTDQNKTYHKTAQKYLAAAGQIMLDTYKTALSCTKAEETQKFAESIAKKYIPKSHGAPYEWVRFLEGITPKGIIAHPETILNSCKNVVIISDKFGACANIIMNRIRNFALLNGYEIITLKSAFLPTVITEHIIIPKLSLAFVTENDYIKFDTDVRRTHARRFTSNKLIHHSQNRIKFNLKITKILLNSASENLKKAKAVHDDLEECYKAIMDYDTLNKFTEDFINKLFT